MIIKLVSLVGQGEGKHWHTHSTQHYSVSNQSAAVHLKEEEAKPTMQVIFTIQSMKMLQLKVAT